MKFFNKRSATAMLLAVAMMSTSISSVFAEGSREMTTVPEGTSASDLSANRAVRPYLEWKDRDQFGMPSKNVINVYAKAGETVFFGSDVTQASDRSIEAVVRTESGFQRVINSDGADWAGSSIAVTLPSTADANVAFDPENATLTTEEEIESLFLDGTQLTTSSYNQNAVYLFNVTENGAGHIANPTMEQNGPNGVDGTTDGYDPLSFVAPITGTYSFRFLSREYVNSDRILIPLKDKSSLASISIDFQGLNGELSDGAITSDKQYYEPAYGDYITIHGESGRYNTAVTMTQDRTVAASDYSDSVTYVSGQDNYLTIGKNQTWGGGAISFIPHHDDVELEIVWRSTGSNSSEHFYAIQNGHGDTQSDRITATTTGDMQVTRISNSGGYPIEAGSELRIYAQNNSNHGIEIYEIRYYYNRVDVGSDTVATPSPTPEPTPEPTATPEPIVWEYTTDLSAFSGLANYQDKVITEDDLEVTLYGAPSAQTGNKDRGFSYIETSATATDGTTYTNALSQYAANSFLNFSDGAPTDATAGVIAAVAKVDNVKLEIVWSDAPDNNRTYLYSTTDGSTSTGIGNQHIGSDGTRTPVTTTVALTKNTPLYLYFDRQGTYVYAINYIVENAYPYSAMDESIDYTAVSADYTSDYSYDGTITDELYDMTFYSNSTNERGFKYRSVDEVEVNGKTYTESLYQNAAGTFLNMTDGVPTDNTGGVIAVTPKHESAKVELVVKNGNTSKSLNVVASGAVTGTYGSIAVGESGSIITGSLPSGETTYLHFDQQWTDIYEIIYHFEGTEETGTTSEVAMLSATEYATSSTYSLDFTQYTEAPVADSTDYLVDENGNKGLTVTFLGGTWKINGGIAPSENADRPSVSNGLYSAGCALRFTPERDGKVIIDYKLGYNKKLIIENTTMQTVALTISDSTLTEGNIDTTLEEYACDVVAGNTYTVYVTGTGNPYYGMYFTPTTSDAWTATGSTTYVTEADGEYTITQTASTGAAPVYYNLLSIMENAPEDITTATGTITVSYDLYRPSTNKGSSNWFADISTDTNVATWGGGNAGTFGRLSGYGPYGSDFKFVPGTGATNGTTYDFTSAADDTWTTVTFTIDLGAKTVKAAMGDDSSSAMSDSYPTGLANALYLNVQPNDKDDASNDVVLKMRNITASYAEAVVTPEPTAAPVDVTLKPVSNAYTWDFYNMKGLGSSTQYASDTIIGEYPNAEDGTDYDYSYTYDMMIHASETVPVTINNGTLFMYWGGTFNSDGTPDAGVLEFIPYWSGEVTVSFNYGNVQIKQLNGAESEIVTSTGDNDTQSITLTVEAGKPVYIYPTGGSCSAYIRGVKYTPDEPSAGLERGIDEKWAVTGSMVAAWDITVAQGGGQNVEGDVHTWDVANELYTSDGSDITVDGLTKHGSGGISGETSTLNGAQVSGLKMNEYYNDSYTNNYFSYTPDSSGTITVHAYAGVNDGTRYLNIEQNGSVTSVLLPSGYAMATGSAKVAADSEVKIYVTDANADNGTWFCYAVEYAEDSYYSDGYVSIPGRAWADILFLNAGNYVASIYPKLNILTEEGFLYDFYMNGVQPYGFVFYSNNRGFLFDRWSLYSNPELSGQTSTTARLQSLEHSFYSWASGSDVGTPPVHIEKDGNNNPIVYNGNIMQSTIDGNYIPVDKDKDSTHKMFFNSPENNPSVLNAYTGLTSLRTINASESVYESLLQDIEYVGLGNAARNDSDTSTVNYGTVGIGGRFELTIDADEAAVLESLGADSISILLDFSSYDLDETGTAPVPVLAADGTWAKTSSQTDAEKNNLVSLSTVVNGTGNYTLAWDGRDAYGNVVPEGVYSDNIKSFVEMGMAHFPILDAEHNPNGFKVSMVNDGNEKSTYLYYNNEAVAPKVDADDPSAWYFTSWSQKADEYLPSKIGDGLNMVSGWDTSAQGGAMTYGEYSAEIEGSEAALEKVYAGLNSNKGKAGGDGGYGNYTAIDMWSKYEREANQNLSIGVAPIVDLKPYVSFVAIDGKVENGTLPFQVSHVGYSGQVLEEYEDHLGDATKDTETAQKFGHTISTGFVTKLSSASGFTNSQVAWNVTIPVAGTLSSVSTDESGNTTTTNISTPTFIKIPETATLTTQEDVDDAEYLAYEMYSGLFDDYAIADDEVNVGDEADPDWNADASLNEDAEPGIMDTPDSAETANDGITEESYIEAMSLSEDSAVAGDYNNESYWDVTFNVNTTATLSDEVNSINRGNIYQVEQIGSSDTGKANIKLRYSLPTTISGSGTVVLGLVIDNLYAPGAEATATFGSSNLEEYHDITTLLTGESNAVRATSFNEYWTNSNNEYYTGKTISATEASKINYEINFLNDTAVYAENGDGISVVVDGVTIGDTDATYTLFNGNVVLNGTQFHNSHGAYMYGPVTVMVPGPVDIAVGNCSYSGATITLTDSSGTSYGSVTQGDSQACKTDLTLSYTGEEATTLTLTFSGGAYVPYINVVSR